MFYHLKTRHCVTKVKPTAIQCILFNDVTSKSCEQRLHIANLFLLFKPTFYKLCNPHGMPTFKTEVLSNVQL